MKNIYNDISEEGDGMFITFMVGNGFDKSLGVDTSYQGFYKWYCQQSSDELCIEELKKEIKRELDSGFENWSDFEYGLAQYTANFTMENASDFIICYEDAHKSLIEYLKKQAKAYPEINEHILDVDLFRDGLANFFQELSSVERKQFNDIFSAESANNALIQFISFNYTDFLDRYLKIISGNAIKTWTYYGQEKHLSINHNVMHVNGTWDQYPIIGVCDSNLIKNKSMLNIPGFQEIMLKERSSDEVGELWYESAKKMISMSKIVCLFGLSIGSSDSLWWTYLSTWLAADSTRELVIFWYTGKPMDNISLYNRVELRKAIIHKIAEHSNWSDSQVDVYSKRFHVVFDTKKVLQIKAFNDTQLENIERVLSTI